MLKGIYTPSLATFLDDDGINEGELRRMINWLIEKGVSGLYPNGSTGEFIRLSFEERKRVIYRRGGNARQTPSLADARPRSDRFRCGGRKTISCNSRL